MLIILKKIAYVLIIIGVNTYICSYLAAKLSARMELRRGYRLTRVGGAGFPAVRFLSYLARSNSAGVWSFIVFISSMLIWTAVPFTAELVLIDMDSSVLAALLFLILAAMLNASDPDKTRYGIVWGQVIKRVISNLSLIAPILICTASLIMVNRTFSLKEIVELQRDYWNVVYQPLGLIITVFSAVLIFKIFGLNGDGKQGLSAVNHAEGAGFTGAIFRFSRYSIVLFIVYLINLLYLGGYKNLYFIRGDVILGIKFYVVFLFILFAEKALGSRLSHTGTLMRINGKFLIPLSVVNFIITFGFIIYRNIYELI